MSLTFKAARVILQSRIADSSDPTAVDQALNLAQRKVARARRWPELMRRDFFNTVAAYETGTLVATLDSKTWTITGGTFPTDVATGFYRIALSNSDPWYRIVTRSSGTVVLTNDAYQDATVSGVSYIAYKSHYSLDAAVDRVEEMWLHDDGRVVPLISAATDQQVSQFLHYPSGPGTPTHFYMMERDVDNKAQVLVGPNTPDDIWRVEYLYRRKITEDTFAGNLDESRWPVILALASAILYEPEYYERSIVAMRQYQSLLEEEWAAGGEVETQHIRVGESRYRFPGNNDYLDNLLGFGRVSDPS